MGLASEIRRYIVASHWLSPYREWSLWPLPLQTAPTNSLKCRPFRSRDAFWYPVSALALCTGNPPTGWVRCTRSQFGAWLISLLWTKWLNEHHVAYRNWTQSCLSDVASTQFYPGDNRLKIWKYLSLVWFLNVTKSWPYARHFGVLSNVFGSYFTFNFGQQMLTISWQTMNKINPLDICTLKYHFIKFCLLIPFLVPSLKYYNVIFGCIRVARH